MSMKTFAIAASMTLALTGAAFAQTAAGGGSSESTMKNPGSVKSDGEKTMERSSGGAMESTGSTMAPAGTSGGPATGSPGSTGGGNSGNASTGSGAAPSGK